jgi:hypothetical protein
MTYLPGGSAKVREPGALNCTRSTSTGTASSLSPTIRAVMTQSSAPGQASSDAM